MSLPGVGAGGIFTRFEDLDGNSFGLAGFDELTRGVEAQRLALAKKYEATSMLGKIIGKAARVTYVIDKNGKIAGFFKAELSAGTHLNGVRDLLAKLS